MSDNFFEDLLKNMSKEINKNVDNIKKFDVHDFMTSNDNIKRAFAKMSDDDKNKVVNTLNNIDEIFGKKTKKWSVDEFDFKPETKETDGDNVKPEKTVKRDIEVTDEDDANKSTESKEDKVTFNEVDDQNIPRCAKNQDSYDCNECKYDDICDNSKTSDKDSEDNNGTSVKKHLQEAIELMFGDESGDEEIDDELTIRERLLKEIEDGTNNEWNKAKKIVDYVIAQLQDKEKHNYTLHPGCRTIVPAVEVVVPDDIISDEDYNDSLIMTIVCDDIEEYMDIEGEVTPSIDYDKTIRIYIPLE